MEGILFEDQLYSTPKSQSYYSRNNTTTCRPNDLIMISNHQGSYLFASCGQNESPIFKVRDSRGEYGQIQLRLTVMEVIYPNELFNSQNNRANILRAIREGLAVVKESDSVITFTVNRNQRIEPIDLQEIDYVSPVQVNSPVCISGNCEEGIRGCVKVEGKCSNRYAFFLTRRPKNGIVKLNEKTGEWTYQTAESCCDSDTFEITVWNFAGGCASQCIHINCEQEQGPFDVNIINTPLPVIVGNPVPVFGDVRVINSPTVIIEQPIEVVTGITPLSVTFPGVIDVSIVNLDLSVIVETIVIDQVVDVNILTIPEITIAELPAVELSGTPTVVLDQIVEVSVVNPLTIASLPEVTVVSLPAVELSGTPTVVLDQIVEVSVVNPLTIASLPEVTVASLPAVELSGTPTVALDQIVGVSVVTPLTLASLPEVTVASLPAVELSGTPTVALDQIVGVSVVTPLT
ncbi:MAG: hypothetical protein J6D33_06505, partial [Turicibacter sp.]|nr:hypothetical protein [Turicibacter sp.]